MIDLLIAEDDDRKYADVVELLDAEFPNTLNRVRVTNVIDTEDAALSGGFKVCILDISMNIAPGVTSSSVKGGHADLGGMEVIEKLFYYDSGLYVIILTGFDIFDDTTQGAVSKVLKGFEEIRSEASKLLGKKLIATIRYGNPGWQDQLTQSLSKVIIA